jgi:hypothetical protein
MPVIFQQVGFKYPRGCREHCPQGREGSRCGVRHSKASCKASSPGELVLLDESGFSPSSACRFTTSSRRALTSKCLGSCSPFKTPPISKGRDVRSL